MNDIIRHIKNQITDTVRNSLLKIDLAGTDTEEFKKALESEIEILVSLGDGDGSATAWGCDLTYDYVKINGDYRT